MTTNVLNRKNNHARLARDVKKTLAYIVLIVITIIVIFPFYFTVESSFKDMKEISGEFTWFPQNFTLSAYRYILGDNAFDMSLLRAFGNTMVIVLPSMLVGLFVSTMAAYTFAKRKFTGGNTMFWILLVSMMIPGTMTMMPQYIIFAELDWVDTVFPLMLPGMFGSATCIFFMRQFIAGLPDSLVEAGKLDGMNHFQIFVKIVIPLSMPALISQGILWFLAGYNDYMGPLLYLNDPELKTLQVALAYFSSSGMGSANLPAIMAGAVLTIIPPLVLYVMFQKFFISGIAVSGLKA